MFDSKPAGAPEHYRDQVLVTRAQRGDRDALGELFMRHLSSVRRLLVSVLGPATDLDDLAQDVFLQVHRSLKKFRGDSRFTTWLHRIVINVAVSHLRKKTRAQKLAERLAADLDREDANQTPHDSSLGKEMARRLYAILETVSPKRRAAFVLYHIEGRSLEELARLMGIPRATAKSRVWFARREVRKKAGQDVYLGPLLEELQRK